MSARKQMSRQRDFAQNKRKSSAPFGRYEDKSAVRASQASKKAVKRGSAEGPKKSMPVKKTAAKRMGKVASPSLKKIMRRKNKGR